MGIVLLAIFYLAIIAVALGRTLPEKPAIWITVLGGCIISWALIGWGVFIWYKPELAHLYGYLKYFMRL